MPGLCVGSENRSVAGDDWAAPFVVHANARGIELMMEAVGRGRQREIHRIQDRHVGAAEIDVQVLALDRPVGSPA